MNTYTRNRWKSSAFVVVAGALLVAILLISVNSIPIASGVSLSQADDTSVRGSVVNLQQMIMTNTLKILVDDFAPQPFGGNPIYFYNRLGGDRGALNNSDLQWGQGVVTMTVASGQTWGGLWTCLNHPCVDKESINFSHILPKQITPTHQSRITGVTVKIKSGTPGSTFRLELKDKAAVRWSKEITLTGGAQILVEDLASHLPTLTEITELVWLLDHTSLGASVVVDEISFAATTPITDVATWAFVSSYGMLLANWNPTTGLVRDKATDPSGDFDAIQATGALAAATAIANQLGIVSHEDAVQIVNRISNTLLINVPRYHGLWPHWVEKIGATGTLTIVKGLSPTEWSSVDSVIAAVALREAQLSLGLDASGTERMMGEVDWGDLTLKDVGISHGYTYSGTRISYAWDTFGGESWLLATIYAAVKNQVPTLRFPNPPTFNGSGFITELSWLFFPAPSFPDYWGTDWQKYQEADADKQIDYYPKNYPTSCFAKLGLFGLSAAEVPDPSKAGERIYRAFGVGGVIEPNDGMRSPDPAEISLGAPVIVPHYSAMIASLRPTNTLSMWNWLLQEQLFSPLNNVESLMFPNDVNCDGAYAIHNGLKGSWNLALQTLGWGNYLAEQRGLRPILWQAAEADDFLRSGYKVVASSPTNTPTATPTSTSTATPTSTPTTTQTPTTTPQTPKPTPTESKVFMPSIMR